jgi:hypothetical protein
VSKILSVCYQATTARATVAYARGLKGGKARAAKLTPEERSQVANKAARARWAGRTPS